MGRCRAAVGEPDECECRSSGRVTKAVKSDAHTNLPNWQAFPAIEIVGLAALFTNFGCRLPRFSGLHGLELGRRAAAALAIFGPGCLEQSGSALR